VPEGERVFIGSVEPFQHAHSTLLTDLAPDPRSITQTGALEYLTGKVRAAVALH